MITIRDSISFCESRTDNVDVYKYIISCLKELQDYRENNNSCEYCKHKDKRVNERPCSMCSRNFVNMFEKEEV